MTVNEYRKQNPKCDYCRHSYRSAFGIECKARQTTTRRWTAKKCPLYEPEEYPRKTPEPPNIDSGVVFVKK